MSSALDGVDPEYARDLLLIVESVSHAASAKVIGGQLAVGDVYPILERTIRRLSQHPAMDGHRPAGWHYGPRGD
jgi:hypothetical protein